MGFYTLLKFLVREGERQLAQFLLECCRYRDIPIESERRKCGEEVRFITQNQMERHEDRFVTVWMISCRCRCVPRS